MFSYFVRAGNKLLPFFFLSDSEGTLVPAVQQLLLMLRRDLVIKEVQEIPTRSHSIRMKRTQKIKKKILSLVVGFAVASVSSFLEAGAAR